MNTEKLRFVAGETTVPEGEQFFCSQIHVMSDQVWLSRIVAYGDTAEDAKGLRDRLMWALQAETAPTLWQYESKCRAGFWYDLADVGEAVRAKAEGYNIRSLFAKNPLPEEPTDES